MSALLSISHIVSCFNRIAETQDKCEEEIREPHLARRANLVDHKPQCTDQACEQLSFSLQI
jgi:hypothetical protein